MKEEHGRKIESKEIFYDELEEFAREKIRQHFARFVGAGSDRVVRAREKPAQSQSGRTTWVPQRLRQAQAVHVKYRDHRDSSAARVRNLDERFISKVLPLFKRQSKQVRDLMPELYLHGLASGDFELALRGLLGEGAPLSASSLQRLKEKWEDEYERWRSEPIEEQDWVYLWTDGIYVKAGIGKEKAALLVVIWSEEGREQAVFGFRGWASGE